MVADGIRRKHQRSGNQHQRKSERVHGSRSAASTAAGWRRIVNPRRRRSTIAMVPMEKANPIKCRLWTTGKAHSGPFMAFAQGLVVSHSKNDGADTLATLYLCPRDSETQAWWQAAQPGAGTRHSIAHFSRRVCCYVAAGCTLSPAAANQLDDLVGGRQTASLLLGIDFLPVNENVQRAWPAQADASGNLELAFDAIFQAHGLRLDVVSKETALDFDGHGGS